MSHCVGIGVPVNVTYTIVTHFHHFPAFSQRNSIFSFLLFYTKDSTHCSDWSDIGLHPSAGDSGPLVCIPDSQGQSDGTERCQVHRCHCVRFQHCGSHCSYLSLLDTRLHQYISTHLWVVFIHCGISSIVSRIHT